MSVPQFADETLSSVVAALAEPDVGVYPTPNTTNQTSTGLLWLLTP